MTFFIVKKPTFIQFNMEKKKDTSSLKSVHQILYDGTYSNAALVKLKNGTWCIKYGDKLLELKEVEAKESSIVKMEGNKGEVLAGVKSKWILQNSCGL